MGDPLFAHLTADSGNRIVLPKYISERVPWLTGSGPVTAWAYLVSPGRIRILSDSHVMKDPALEPVRTLIIEGISAVQSSATEADENSRTLLAARLVPLAISLPSTGWRLAVPRSFESYLPPEYNLKAFTAVNTLEGHLEVWYTQLVSSSLSINAAP